MKIAIMQPYIFPYIGYFQLIHAVDTFVLYDDVSYINRGWINRNQILMNGKPFLFTIPLKKASQNRLINEIAIDYSQKWQLKLIKSIHTAYYKAMNFHPVFEVLNTIISKHYDSIAILNLCAIKQICTYLDIGTKIIDSSSKYNNKHLNGERRIIDICLQEKANIYINPIGGKELYHRENFLQSDIELKFIQSEKQPYYQSTNTIQEFIPWLSIIDIMMHNSIDNIKKKLLSSYTLHE